MILMVNLTKIIMWYSSMLIGFRIDMISLVCFQYLPFRLSRPLKSAKLISRYLENSDVRPQTVQAIRFHFAKRLWSKLPKTAFQEMLKPPMK